MNLPLLNSFVKSQEGPFEVQFAFGNNNWVFDLEKHDIRAADMRIEVVTANGSQVYKKGACNTYKGFVNDDTLQRARLYISDTYLGGFFEHDGGTFHLSPAWLFLQEEQGQNLSLTFVLHKNKVNPADLLCAMDVDFEIDTSEIEFRARVDCADLNANWNSDPRYLELAIETDNEFLAKIPVQPGDGLEMRIKKATEEIESRVLSISALYEDFNLQILLSHIQLWDAPDPYNSSTTNIEQMWNEVWGYWKDNMNHIHRDHVHFYSGRHSNALGVAGGSGIWHGQSSVCGTNDDIIGQYDGGYYWAYSYTVSGREPQADHRTAAHEIGHALGLYHVCGCFLMYSNQIPNCNVTCSHEFLLRLAQSAVSRNELCRYLNGTNLYYNRANDVCLQYPPPVDYKFGMILDAEEVLIGDLPSVCVDETVEAAFFNEFDDYQNLSWNYSSNLTLVASPSNNERVFQAAAAGPAYVSVSFLYQGQALTYTRSFYVGTPIEPIGPPGIVPAPGFSPPQYDIVFYGVPGAHYYRYEITMVNEFGSPVSQENGTTTNLFPLIRIPADLCAQIWIWPGNDCGLASVGSYYEACPPGWQGIARTPAEQHAAEGKRAPSRDEMTGNPAGLELMPNPAREMVNIISVVPLQRIAVFNTAGQLVHEMSAIQQGTHELSLVGWTSGTYILKATTPDGVITKLFVVTK